MAKRINLYGQLVLTGLLVLPIAALGADSFNASTGVVYMPVVSVGADNYQVEMFHQGNLVFNVTSALPASTTSAAPDNFDFSTGILHIPSVMVGNENFEVEMHHQGDLVFNVTKANLIAPQDNTGSNSDLLSQNTYYQVFLDSPQPYSSLSRVSFNAGTANFKELYTSGSDPLSSGSVSYSLDNDGRATINGSHTAATSSDGSMILNVDTQYNDGYIGMSLLTKVDSTTTANSLNGKYYCAALDAEPYSVFYEATFNGNGAGSVNVIEDSNGDSNSQSFTYSVADGMLTIYAAGSTSRGGIASNGNVLTSVQRTPGYDPTITVCVKSSSGMSVGSVSGKYYGGFFDAEPYTAFSSMNLDGSGSVVSSELSISHGTPDTNTSLSYSVQSDGRFKIAGRIIGAVSPDGRVIIYTNTNPSYDLSIGVLIKSR